ncbi:hypothetical protein ACIFOT_29815 [Neobacillus sp. NRS-1170]|uniref:hypothetical protein n=1 Tax=Neobacillus sp. NRS-1170 TaxID=3233898 RepID=UPI003D2830FC
MPLLCCGINRSFTGGAIYLMNGAMNLCFIYRVSQFLKDWVNEMLFHLPSKEVLK